MSGVKQVVYIHSHRESIGDGIFAMILERYYMRCFQHFRHFYVSDNASSISCKDFSSEAGLVRSVLAFYKFSFSIGYHFV